MRKGGFLPYIPLVCAVLVAVVSSFAQTGTSSKSPKSSVATKTTVQEITLSEYAPGPLSGPNQKVYEQHCLLCHSSRYVLMQPTFSRTVWEKEVKKMVDVYGAPISAPEQQQIVDYLVAVRGPSESK